MNDYTGSLFSDGLDPLLETARIGLWKLCVDSGKLLCNRFLQKMAGLPECQPEEGMETLLGHLTQDEAQRVRYLLHSCLSGQVRAFQDDHHFVATDGFVYQVTVCCHASADPDERIRCLTGIVYGIEREQAERETNNRAPGLPSRRQVLLQTMDRQVIVSSGYHIMPGFAPEDVYGFACGKR